MFVTLERSNLAIKYNLPGHKAASVCEAIRRAIAKLILLLP